MRDRPRISKPLLAPPAIEPPDASLPNGGPQARHARAAFGAHLRRLSGGGPAGGSHSSLTQSTAVHAGGEWHPAHLSGLAPQGQERPCSGWMCKLPHQSLSRPGTEAIGAAVDVAYGSRDDHRQGRGPGWLPTGHPNRCGRQGLPLTRCAMGRGKYSLSSRPHNPSRSRNPVPGGRWVGIATWSASIPTRWPWWTPWVGPQALV